MIRMVFFGAVLLLRNSFLQMARRDDAERSHNDGKEPLLLRTAPWVRWRLLPTVPSAWSYQQARALPAVDACNITMKWVHMHDGRQTLSQQW
jgi:hypothetical protein